MARYLKEKEEKESALHPPVKKKKKPAAKEISMAEYLKSKGYDRQDNKINSGRRSIDL